MSLVFLVPGLIVTSFPAIRLWGLVTPNRRFDVLALQNGANNGIHWQSSAGRPVLNALIHEQISVPDTGAVIVIDYDLGRAFTTPQVLDSVSADSSFTFMPQFRAVDATRTGTITGVVRAHTAGGAAVADASVQLYLGYPGTPENTWPGLATGKTDATGAFRILFVTRSAWWATTAWAGATYIVAVDPPSGAGLGRDRDRARPPHPAPRSRSTSSTARATPSSARMRAPRSAARRRTSPSPVTVRIAAARRSVVSRVRRMGAGPTPSSLRRLPQKNWSAKNGTVTAGTPARSPADVVPAPP